jgi:hypothetical protein
MPRVNRAITFPGVERMCNFIIRDCSFSGLWYAATRRWSNAPVHNLPVACGALDGLTHSTLLPQTLYADHFSCTLTGRSPPPIYAGSAHMELEYRMLAARARGIGMTAWCAVCSWRVRGSSGLALHSCTSWNNGQTQERPGNANWPCHGPNIKPICCNNGMPVGSQ